MFRNTNLVALIAGLALAGSLSGCGSAAPEPPPAAGPGAPGAPPLLTREKAPGEVLFAAESSPRTHGPVELRGRYTVRFAQYAPEAPNRRFGGEVPFVADLLPAGRASAPPIPLFSVAAERGGRTVDLDGGRYVVDVSFGDFPYVIRFTPAG